MKPEIFDYPQGSPEWLEFRQNHDGASEAAAMLGISKKTTRSELMHLKHTGMQKEFSAWVQENVLDKGHEIEALTRPIIEKRIGRKLHPLVYAIGRTSASVDGITMSGDIAWENKQYNQEYAALAQAGEVPAEHIPQCQQILMVTGAEKLLFSISDGTEENTNIVEVWPDTDYFDRLTAGWKQFHADLAEYQPPEYAPESTATPTKDLPAVSIQINGAISLISNLDAFGEQLNAFVGNINKKPETDQDFADAEAAIKTLGKAEDALEAAMQSGLAQTASVDEMCRTVKLHKETARTTRLMLEKLVKAQKDTIRTNEIQRGKDALQAHINTMNKRLGKQYMPVINGNFAEAIKGKKSIASVKEAINNELTKCTIDASLIADKIEINLNTMRELAKDHMHLFHDEAYLISKSNDDLTNVIKLRISDFEAAEAKKAEELREKIRKEEEAKAQAKIEAEARAKAEEEARQARIDADIQRAKDINVQAAAAKAVAQSGGTNETQPVEKKNADPEQNQQAVVKKTPIIIPAANLVHIIRCTWQCSEQDAHEIIINAASELTEKKAA